MGRPPRRLVSREGIMRAALALVDEEGPDALSTTRVAQRLGVKGPSSTPTCRGATRSWTASTR
ncbi:TetR family transcriptional regulator [Streptomyces sp. AD16]|nr:TetR family transcriptional regulator [Streptomyces sp. AD16]